MTKPTLLLTTTGEPFQPVRLKWSVPSKAYCLPRLRQLRCVAVDAETNELSLWLVEEAAALKFGDERMASRAAPGGGRQVVLGRFRFPEARSLVLEVRSIPRAIALARLLRPVLDAGRDKKVQLVRVRVVNRWFAASEGAEDLPKLDASLDQGVTVIRWEETEREIEAVLAKGRTPEEKRALHAAWHESRRHRDVPLVEDFPCHPEEENDEMSDLETTLNFRLLRASRVWAGERVTLRQVIEEAVARVPKSGP